MGEIWMGFYIGVTTTILALWVLAWSLIRGIDSFLNADLEEAEL
ncbi:hypothetical protein [Natrinema versiforme]|nr:hypothetical protein [Natrinema versiforme]